MVWQCNTGIVWQCNTVVDYILSPKFVVKAAFLTDYQKLVKYFSETKRSLS